MTSLKLLTFFSLLALVSTSAFADDSLNPSNPNCSPGVKGCTANYPTSDITKDGPAASSAYDANKNPNCSPGEKGCSANYPTSDIAKKAVSK